MKRSAIVIAVLLLEIMIGNALAAERTVFGPKTYMRTTGKPNVYKDAFVASPGRATILLTNGEEDGSHRISSARIILNEIQVLAPDAFNQEAHRLKIPVDLTENNELRVELRSIPGSYFTLRIMTGGEAQPPSVSISATPNSIPKGGSAMLNWSSSNATNASIEPQIGVVTPTGSREVSPESSTTYTITVSGPGGVASSSASVTVVDRPPSPPSGLLAIPGDEQVYLSWDAGGEVNIVGYHVYRSRGEDEPFVRLTGEPLAINELFAMNLTNSASYAFAVTTVDAAGSESAYSGQATATPLDTPAIRITSPPDGAVVETGNLCITGMVSRDVVGVIVNGGAANVRDRRFIVCNAPVRTGENVITASAAGPLSEVGSDSVAVTSSADFGSITLNVEPNAGIPPITVDLDLRVNLLTPVAQIEWDLDGDGWPEQAAGPTLRKTYAQARIYRPAAIISDVKHVKYAIANRVDAYLDPVVSGSFGSGSLVDIATDGSGNLYALDASAGQVKVYAPGGAFMRAFGSSGSGNGQMRSPQGLALDASGNVYVADTYNYRVQVFDNAGSFLYAFGRPGAGDGQLNRPEGVAVSSEGDIYVADTGNHRVQVFQTGGIFKHLWGIPGIGAGQFNMPRGIAVLPGNDVYVADSGNDRIQHFSGLGAFKKALTGLSNPRDVCVSGDLLFVADTGNGRVVKYVSRDPKPIQIAKAGLSAPLGLAAGSRLDRETAFVADDGVIKELELRILYPDAVWEQMKQALIDGNIEEAMGYHREEVRSVYRAIYENLGANLAQEARAMQPVELIYVRGNQAKYRIKRMQEINGQTMAITYYIYFVRDENNVWHIDRY